MVGWSIPSIYDLDGIFTSALRASVNMSPQVIYIEYGPSFQRRQVIERKELSKATKLRVINAMIVPTLLYESETWTLQKRHRSKIQAMEMRYLRKIDGVTRLEFQMKTSEGGWRLKQC